MSIKPRKYNNRLNPQFVRGAVVAASLAEELQGDGEYCLEDRILGKLNIITKRQMRKNRKKAQKP